MTARWRKAQGEVQWTGAKAGALNRGALPSWDTGVLLTGQTLTQVRPLGLTLQALTTGHYGQFIPPQRLGWG
jgi:hypothetical protein